MMEWTKSKPSQEGWYWMRPPHGVSCIVLLMFAGQGDRARLCVVEEGEMRDLDSYVLNYEWSSEPITEPTSVHG